MELFKGFDGKSVGWGVPFTKMKSVLYQYTKRTTMKITIDTKEDKHELQKVIKLLQQLAEDHIYTNVDANPLAMFSDEPKSESSSDDMAGLVNMFGSDDKVPESLHPKKEERVSDDDEPLESIRVIDF